MRIPNWLSIAIAALFFFYFALSSAPLSDLLGHALGGTVVFLVCFTLFALGWIGGGDAKLMSSMSLWFGWSPDLLSFLTWTALSGLALTVALLLFRALPVLPLGLGKASWIARLHDRKTGVPYGVAIAAGGLVVVYQNFPNLIAI
ncbi:hypothetical protein GCM10011316_31810 [Roseibium aquae]|uniref:Prepilin type IV endopeptidase peptidase domain-containing protein n=2 Tax=Roseibium aquae TaxID=1323746 RepID=A0A916TLM5_9HYPH|nr:hypothetical protein GCM10011316_31810 [Roseibium aquae]